MPKKILLTLILCLLVGLVTQIFATNPETTIQVNLPQVALYIDGEEVMASDRPGQYYNGSSYVPATLEYGGTIYVPIRLVGKQLNKPVGWDKGSRSVWIGEQPPSDSPVNNNSFLPAKTGTIIPTSSDGVTAMADSQPEAPSLFGIRLGDSQEQIEAILGPPIRREPSALGYEWWIYNQDPGKYLQVGLSAGKVVDLYSNAPAAKVGQVAIGSSYQFLKREHSLRETLTFFYQGADVEIVNQLSERPITIVHGVPVIFYLDTHNDNKVTALRLIDKLPLIQGGYYETKWSYQGKSPKFDPPPVSEQQQELIDSAHERQLFDLVNVIRYRHKLPLLTWNEEAADVAKAHSIDMETAHFFDHVSATTGYDPFQRLKQANVSYRLAGENIAAGFPDAIEAHESWLNSPGHRKNVLEKDFSQLGVGVRADYFTQNFITPPSQ